MARFAAARSLDGMGIVLDSSILIRVERDAKAAPAVPASWFDQDIAIAAITAAELLAGVHRADAAHRPRRSAFAEGILAAIPTIAFDLTASRLYVQIEAQLPSAGTMIDRADLQIAVIALARGWSIATLNRADFERVPGLVVIGLDEIGTAA